MFKRFAFPLLLGVGILAMPLRALACTNDVDCGGCGLICSWDAGATQPHVCISAAAYPADPGWCGTSAECACSGQTCVGTTCTPLYVDGCSACSPTDCDGGVYVFPDGGDPGDAGVCMDSGVDAGVDAGEDAGMDAGEDAGVDAGTDAGTDAGSTSTTTGGSATTTGGSTTAGTTTGTASTTGGATTTGAATTTGGNGSTGTSSTSGGATTGGGTTGGGTTGGGTSGTTAGQSCSGDKDCGTVCGAGGFVCSWATNNHMCVPWDGSDEGYCNAPGDCVCPGQTCDLSQHCYPRDSSFLTSSSSTGGSNGSPDAGSTTGSSGGCTAQGGGPEVSAILGALAMIWLVRRVRRARTPASE
jgi:uncharacterized protein (TIGR03382 family)